MHGGVVARVVFLVPEPPLERVVHRLLRPWNWLIRIEQTEHVVARALAARVIPVA